MKNYLIITPSLNYIGGAELYALRRAKHLSDLGYRVMFLTGKKESIYLDDLNKYKIFYIEELPLFYQGKDSVIATKTLKLLKSEFLSQDIFIESNHLICALWGELIAKELSAKHIYYMLAELDITKNKKYVNFFLAKLKTNTLIGLTDQSLRISFGNLWEPGMKNLYVNIGFSIYENEHTIPIDLQKYFTKNDEFKVLTISRLEKTYIESLIQSCYEISSTNPYKVFSLIIIGDTKDSKIKNDLQEKYRGSKNLHIHFLGYVSPISNKFFESVNVFVGMGTAVINSAATGCPTIVIDPRDNKAAGFFGDNLSNFAYPQSTMKYHIYELLQKAIDNKKYIVNTGKMGKEIFHKEFDAQLTMHKLDGLMFNEKQRRYYIAKVPFKEKVRLFIWKMNLYPNFIYVYKFFCKKKFINI